ncbi:poly(A)-specific ribonuclease [Clonorchis sinensis]|uniref:PAB-dependent poly(A)-specific ribonuclease subunit 2 n=2 Tax=Clonorchis sinensis TaxID=79923 RepID=H2KS93_CLOSI|nr:poly(A)-specific ribonuclease [Clonorchis sinensis]GAA33544.2 PAB-dependent poly(A)-specific ribonuclease subunit 2 [Clonorchis sinensis]
MAYLPDNSAQHLSYPSDMEPAEGHLGIAHESGYPTEIPTTDIYQTGGYWLTGTQIMNGVFPSDNVADVAFDPLEELVWCITRMGQLTAFFSVSLERYITTNIPLLPNTYMDEGGSHLGELKQIYPSPRPPEHAVYMLASNALHAYTKFGRPITCAVNKLMVDLECLTVTGPTGATPGLGMGGGVWGTANEAEFCRIFLGGLQPNILELDALDRWGEVIRTIDVGLGGSVVLRSFSSGMCAGTTNGKVMVIDARTPNGIVRELDAHTGEISDITVVPHGYTLVTCGWSRLQDSGLRMDRLLKVYDLRSGRAQVPLSASLDPCFARFFPGCTDRLLAASQAGGFQTIQWGTRVLSPNDIGQLWPSYDRLVALDISHNANGLVFGTETGHLQLYLRDMNVCQFNANPLPTEFASPLAESLWPTNNIGSIAPPSYPLMLVDDPANPLYGTNLMTLGKTAAEAVELQLLAASLHQPAATTPDNLRNPETFDLVERRKAEAANEAVLVAYKPVEYDDYRFSFASVPFAANPPPVTCELTNIPKGLQKLQKTEPFTSSDWPDDLCEPRARPMLPVEPELVFSANRKRTVRKPAHWGSVWHPYSDNPDDRTQFEQNTRLGRFVDVSPEEETATEKST